MNFEDLKQGERYAVQHIKGTNRITEYCDNKEELAKKIKSLESKGKMCAAAIIKDADIFNPFACSSRQIYSTGGGR